MLLPTPAASGSASSARQGLVAFTALWPGGRKREEARLRGLHDLLVRVWPHATASLPGAALRRCWPSSTSFCRPKPATTRWPCVVSFPARVCRRPGPAPRLPRVAPHQRSRGRAGSPRCRAGQPPQPPRGDAASARWTPVRGASTVEFDAARYAEQLLAQALKRQTASPASHGEAAQRTAARATKSWHRVSPCSRRGTCRICCGATTALLRSLPSSVTSNQTASSGSYRPGWEAQAAVRSAADPAAGVPAEASLPASSTDGAATTPSSHSPDAAPPQLFGFAATAQAHLLLVRACRAVPPPIGHAALAGALARAPGLGSRHGDGAAGSAESPGAGVFRRRHAVRLSA